MPDKQLLRLLGEDKRYIYRAAAWMLTGSLSSIGFTACLCYGLHLLLTDAKASFCLLPFALGAVCTAVRFIAAAAASQPELLLLDKPAVGQDGEGLRTLLHALNLLHTRTGSTIVTVTHDRRCAGALCDQVAWLREGRIKKTGGSELIEAAWGNSAVL